MSDEELKRMVLAMASFHDVDVSPDSLITAVAINKEKKKRGLKNFQMGAITLSDWVPDGLYLN